MLNDYKEALQDKFLASLLNCGSNDVDTMLDYLNVANILDIGMDEIVKDMKQNGTDIDVNTVIYSSINIIFNTIMDYVEESLDEYTKTHKKLSEKVDRIRQNFEPYVNCADSHFNNYLDEIDFFDLPSCAGREYVELIKKW